jgi:ACS family sodium-dependent inorganic phosphate cotransporter
MGSSSSSSSSTNGSILRPPHPWLVASARAGVGVAQGFLIPAVHTVLSQWVPPHERARAVSLSTSGMYLGSAAAMLALPGVVARAGPGASVALVGFLGLAWAALWFAVGREVPHREAIIPLSTTVSGGGSAVASASPSGGGGKGAAAATNGGGEPPSADGTDPTTAINKGRPSATPWRRMLASPAVLAIVCNNFAFHYAFYVVLNWLPTFFSAVLGRDLAALGPLPKALPYLAMFACSNAGGWAGDWLIAPPRSWRVADARKAVNAAGMLSASLALLLMPALASGGGKGEGGGGGGTAAGVIATTLVLSTLGFSRGGFSVNHMDIAPRHAGVVMGFSNTAGTLSGVIGVAATGWMLQRAGGAGESGGWWAAHGVAAAGCVAAAAVFQVFARGDKMFD